MQSCAPGAATREALVKVGIDPVLLQQPDARVPALAYARLWRLLARRRDDEFFGMDPRKLKSGSLEFLCRASMAHDLCMSASTLRRRLAEEGQTYQGLKDSVRKELAVVWLAEADISFAEIASRLGFADVSSFYKAFRKWSGSNPGHYRSLILTDAS